MNHHQLLRDCARLLERLEAMEVETPLPHPDAMLIDPFKECAECRLQANRYGHAMDCELARIKRELLDVLGRVTA